MNLFSQEGNFDANLFPFCYVRGIYSPVAMYVDVIPLLLCTWMLKNVFVHSLIRDNRACRRDLSRVRHGPLCAVQRALLCGEFTTNHVSYRHGYCSDDFWLVVPSPSGRLLRACCCNDRYDSDNHRQATATAQPDTNQVLSV